MPSTSSGAHVDRPRRRSDDGLREVDVESECSDSLLDDEVLLTQTAPGGVERDSVRPRKGSQVTDFGKLIERQTRLIEPESSREITLEQWTSPEISQVAGVRMCNQQSAAPLACRFDTVRVPRAFSKQSETRLPIATDQPLQVTPERLGPRQLAAVKRTQGRTVSMSLQAGFEGPIRRDEVAQERRVERTRTSLRQDRSDDPCLLRPSMEVGRGLPEAVGQAETFGRSALGRGDFES